MATDPVTDKTMNQMKAINQQSLQSQMLMAKENSEMSTKMGWVQLAQEVAKKIRP